MRATGYTCAVGDGQQKPANLQRSLSLAAIIGNVCVLL